MFRLTFGEAVFLHDVKRAALQILRQIAVHDLGAVGRHEPCIKALTAAVKNLGTHFMRSPPGEFDEAEKRHGVAKAHFLREDLAASFLRLA